MVSEALYVGKPGCLWPPLVAAVPGPLDNLLNKAKGVALCWDYFPKDPVEASGFPCHKLKCPEHKGWRLFSNNCPEKPTGAGWPRFCCPDVVLIQTE